MCRLRAGLPKGTTEVLPRQFGQFGHLLGDLVWRSHNIPTKHFMNPHIDSN